MTRLAGRVWLISLVGALSCASAAQLDAVDPFIANPIPIAVTLESHFAPDLAQYTAAGTPIYVGDAFNQYADAFSKRGFSTGSPATVRAELVQVLAKDFRIRIEAEISVEIQRREVFRKLYIAHSTGTVWDGIYSDRALHWEHATDEALRSIFNEFISDARSGHANW